VTGVGYGTIANKFSVNRAPVLRPFPSPQAPPWQHLHRVRNRYGSWRMAYRILTVCRVFNREHPERFPGSVTSIAQKGLGPSCEHDVNISISDLPECFPIAFAEEARQWIASDRALRDHTSSIYGRQKRCSLS